MTPQALLSGLHKNDLLLCEEVGCVWDCSPDVFRPKPRVGLKKLGFAGPFTQFSEDQLNGNSGPPDHGFPCHDLGVDFDPIHQTHEKPPYIPVRSRSWGFSKIFFETLIIISNLALSPSKESTSPFSISAQPAT